MDCTKCGHPQRQHYIHKDDPSSDTGCFMCVCHAYVGEVEVPKRGSIEPDIKKDIAPYTSTWSLKLNPEHVDVGSEFFGDPATVTIIDGDPPKVILKDD